MRRIVNETAGRLPTEKRRETILNAVEAVFAEKGFHGTTTRELASRAGVSEALMLRHFPTKEALYAAVLERCCQQDPKREALFQRVMALEPSTSSLVLIVHCMFAKALRFSKQQGIGSSAIHKLLLQSLQSDGEFARLFLQRGPGVFVSKLGQCIKAAVKSGDAVETVVNYTLRGWFTHHLTVILMTYCMPDPPAVEYGVSREKLAEQAATFALRGVGLKDEAIKRYYNPKALSLLVE